MFKFKKKRLIITAAFVCSLFLFSSLVSILKIPLLNIFNPPLQLLGVINREIKGLVFYHRNFIQNERLRRENNFLKHKLNNAREAYLENERLNKLLAFKKNSPYKVVASRVIGRSADNWSSLLIIDKGRRNGIKEGFVAINYLGLVGRVSQASEFTSKITLLNDPNLGISAIIQRSRQEGLISGTLSNFLIMRYLPKDSDIKVSDLVMSSGLTEKYPKGLIIGTVSSVGDEFGGLSRYAMVKPAVNLSDLEEVLIIVP